MAVLTARHISSSPLLVLLSYHFSNPHKKTVVKSDCVCEAGMHAWDGMGMLAGVTFVSAFISNRTISAANRIF